MPELLVKAAGLSCVMCATLRAVLVAEQRQLQFLDPTAVLWP